MKKILLCLFVVLFATTCKKNDDDSNENPGTLPDVELKSKVIVSGLSLPWEIVYGPDNSSGLLKKLGKSTV